MRSIHYKYRDAFSLVELSIVLVILGLLVGGVLAGQSLIRAAQLRAVTTEYNRYVAATQSFRDKYFALPGDMTNATAFWGRLSASAWCVSNSGAGTSATGVCDGDGSGIILSTAGVASQSGELFQYWSQLALAGLIEGSYTGLAGSGGGSDSLIGTNIPSSKLSNAGWSQWSAVNFGGDGATYALDYGNGYMFGASQSGNKTQQPIMKPEEAWNIDTKIDDGRPGYGKVIARFWNNTCATGGASASDLANSVYNLSNTGNVCALNFIKAF